MRLSFKNEGEVKMCSEGNAQNLLALVLKELLMEALQTERKQQKAGTFRKEKQQNR